MTVRVTFETATIMDVAKKAAAVAPVKGADFARAAGTLIDIMPSANPNVFVRATNTQVFFLEWLNAVQIENDNPGADHIYWRLPSVLFAQVLNTFPLDASSQVFLTQTSKRPGILEVECGTAKFAIHLMDADDFPMFHPFDPTGLQEAKGFAARFNQVAWAASGDRAQGPISGVRVDGTFLNATDRYYLAKVNCEMPIDTPVTLPPEVVSPLIRDTVDVSVAVAAGKFFMMPDESSQITSVTLEGAYPDLTKVQRRDWPQKVQFSAKDLVASIDRMLLLVGGSERFPKLEVTFGDEQIELRLHVDQVGVARDTIEVIGQAVHDPYTINFLPRIIKAAVSHTIHDAITLGYDPDPAVKRVAPPYIDGGGSYEAWISPRGDVGGK